MQILGLVESDGAMAWGWGGVYQLLGSSQQGEGNRYGQLGVLERESGCRDGKESRCTQPCSIPKLSEFQFC